MPDLDILMTADGSNTVKNNVLGAAYHSEFGAIQESKHIFIENAFKRMVEGKKQISVFEMGFGTGLNAFLTLLETLNKPQINVFYYAIENKPLPPSFFRTLNYPIITKAKDDLFHFENIHLSKWEIEIVLASNFILKKINADFLTFVPQNKVDVIYYDAFAPNIQPELWKFIALGKCYEMLNTGGVFVTYCCKGDVKRALKHVGFSVQKVPGPPGKREILVATKGG